MSTHVNKIPGKEERRMSSATAIERKTGNTSGSQFVDNRAETILQRKLQSGINNTQGIIQQRQVLQMVKEDKPVISFSEDGAQKAVNYDAETTEHGEGYINSGADGTVHTGDMDGRQVIAKTAKENGKAALENEINIFKSKALSGHENIVNALGYSADKKVLVLEKAQGALNSPDMRPKTMPGKIGMILGTGEGLKHMHGKNITHGDLNLKNILVHEDKAKITDFGGSKVFGDESSLKNPVPEGLEGLIDENDPSLVVKKDERMATDRRDFMRVAARIFLDEDKETNADGFVRLKQELTVGGIAADKVEQIVAVLQKKKADEQASHEGDPSAEDMEVFMTLLKGALPGGAAV